MKSECSTKIASTSSTTDNSELIATELTFKKIARESIKAGFRDGADEAKQQNFQKYFDQGFEQGFSNGFRIGILKAKQKLHNSDCSIKNELDRSRQGMCIICKDNELTQTNIENLQEKQRQVIDNFISTMKF